MGEAAVSRVWQGVNGLAAVLAAVLAAFGAKAVILHSVFEADGSPCVCGLSQNGSGDNVCVDRSTDSLVRSRLSENLGR